MAAAFSGRLLASALLALALLGTGGCSSLKFWDKDKGDKVIEGSPEQLYRDAIQDIKNTNYPAAIQRYEMLEARYPFSEQAKQGQLDLIYAYYKNRSAEAAIDQADQFIRENPTHPRVDYAYYVRGLVYFESGANWLERKFKADIAKLRGQMRAEIKKLHQKVKTTVVYVTHDQVEAMTLADRIVVMKDGNIEQVGTPMEVFNHPLTTFVATFIGSPPMNLLPGTIAGQTVRLADGTEVPVPERLQRFVRDGMPVQLGIRPDDISPVGHGLSQDGPGAEVRLTVDLAEPLGMESLIYTRLAGQEVQAKLYGPRIVAPGEVLDFRLALDRAHLFDAASGKSVRAH